MSEADGAGPVPSASFFESVFAPMIRTIRIVGVAAILAGLFRWSQQLSSSRGEEQVPGYTIALAVISLLLLLRAATTEYAGRNGQNFSEWQRDILWGLTLGAFVSMLARLIR